MRNLYIVVCSSGDDADLPSHDSGQDSKKLLALDYLGLSHQEWDVIDRRGTSQVWDQKKLKSKRDEIIFVPSTDPGNNSSGNHRLATISRKFGRN